MWIFFVILSIAVVAAAPDGDGYNSNSPAESQDSGGGYDYSPAVPLITKDVYVHVPPNDQENQVHHQTINLGPSRKHYRVLFIKAPSHGGASISLIPPQNEEKTLIYVLTKKNDGSDIQTSIQASPTEPSKPEVYFIKYKTQEEAALAQRQIQAQFDSLGGTTQVSDEGHAPVTSVIGSLGGSVSGIGRGGLISGSGRFGGGGGGGGGGGVSFGSGSSSHTISASNSYSISSDNNGLSSPNSNYLPPNKKIK